MAFNDKYFLDYEGLRQYDALIKELIKVEAVDNDTMKSVITSLAELAEATETNADAIAENKEAIEILNGDGEGSVSKQVSDAIAALVDNAPETLDTLKEIADWIADDETGSAALTQKVAENAEKIEELKEYVDTQDLAVYNSIKSIESLKVEALFPSKQAKGATAAEAIAAIPEGKAIELTADQTIAEDIVIDKSCYIDANGSTFTGTVTVPADADVIIENATFEKPVVVA